MKVRAILTATFCAIFSVAALAADQTTTDQTSTQTQNQAVSQPQTTQDQAKAGTQTTDKVSKKDAEMLGTLLVINEYEVNAGKVAADKATNPDVKQFAEQIQKDHAQNADDTKTLASKLDITPATSKKSEALEKKGTAEVEKLKALPDEKFDAAYVNAMVKGHKEVLVVLNSFIAQAKNPDVKKHFQATKEAVAQHLKTVQELNGKLKKA